MLEPFLIKLQALKTANVLERDSCETCKIFKNTLFYWASPVAASESFRFPPCNFIKKEIPAKIFFCKISKTIFWQSTSGLLLLKFICKLWEVFQNISFIDPLKNLSTTPAEFQWNSTGVMEKHWKMTGTNGTSRIPLKFPWNSSEIPLEFQQFIILTPHKSHLSKIFVENWK